MKIDWHTDLNEPRVRDYITVEQLLAAEGRLLEARALNPWIGDFAWYGS